MKPAATALAALALASGAHAATYTSSADDSVIFGAASRTDAIGTNSFINGVTVDTYGTFFSPKGVTTAVSSSVFTDVVTDDASSGGHAESVFSFASGITAFGGFWNTAYANSQPGAGLRIDIGNDGTYEFDSAGILPTTLDGSNFYGFKSDTAFTTFSISYRDVSPQQETYQLSGLQFLAVSAVPEPATSAMLLAGLGALVFKGRRRRVD